MLGIGLGNGLGAGGRHDALADRQVNSPLEHVGKGFHREVCIDPLTFGEGGLMVPVKL